MNGIRLEGVRVHNLKNVSLTVPLHRLVVVSGVSGSGKSSLAFDTLYAEGQRRYIETLAPAARQFLPLLDKPDADRIENIPPAVGVRQGAGRAGARDTVATATELYDALRFLFARLGQVVCHGCGRTVRRFGAEDVWRFVAERVRAGTRFQVCFRLEQPGRGDLGSELARAGFRRAVVLRRQGTGLSGKTVELEHCTDQLLRQARAEQVWVVVDRLVAGRVEEARALESLEQALFFGEGLCVLVLEPQPTSSAADRADAASGRAVQRPSKERASSPATELLTPGDLPGGTAEIDGRHWQWVEFSDQYECRACGRHYEEPTPHLFSFDSPLGACGRCHGFGRVPTISFEHLVPDPSKSLREGAIAPWTTPAYRHELDELLALADDYGIPVDVPFSELKPEHLELIKNGVPERNFGGLRGFFRWLERHRYRLGVRVFLNRWRAYRTCPACRGARLCEAALAVRLLPERAGETQADDDVTLVGKNLAEVCELTVEQAATAVRRLEEQLTERERQRVSSFLAALSRRLEYLQQVGLAYVTLDRSLRTLSDGEAKRVSLTTCLGSGLVNTLFVLDEPSCGLHPRDNERILAAVRRLRDAGNTVVVVEHEPEFVRAADHVIDIGPAAGREGGQIVFEGPPGELVRCERSLTGAFLSGRRSTPVPQQRRKPTGWLTLKNVRHHNLRGLTVRFPLGVLCAVTGVSGSGKSSLVEQTLYPALCRVLGKPVPTGPRGRYDAVEGAEQLSDVVRVDTSPIGRTPRSNPVTYMKAFAEIRQTFAQTRDAEVRQFTAKHFSFNAAGGGRCPRCRGAGSIEIEMHFLADIVMTCPECHGTRFRPEILEVKYRGLSIADVLNLTVREAFAFFRSQPQTQRRLGFLLQVGLDYLTLGQPATTLSGGESQRLKLAAHLAQQSKARTLFLLNEPTTGLHPFDVEKLVECLQRLVASGHSVIVIEHNRDLIKCADYVIDLGPEAGEQGGEVVAAGTPEQLCRCRRSVTGRYLREALRR